MTLNFSNKKIIKEKQSMKKVSKSQLLNLGVFALSIAGMLLSSKAQDAEIKELKEEIKLEIKQEKE